MMGQGRMLFLAVLGFVVLGEHMAIAAAMNGEGWGVYISSQGFEVDPIPTPSSKQHCEEWTVVL